MALSSEIKSKLTAPFRDSIFTKWTLTALSVTISLIVLLTIESNRWPKMAIDAGTFVVCFSFYLIMSYFVIGGYVKRKNEREDNLLHDLVSELATRKAELEELGKQKQLG